MTRPAMFCESCESTVNTDDVHSCYDAKAVREQQERERKLAALERAVVEAARGLARATTRVTAAHMLGQPTRHDRDALKSEIEQSVLAVEKAVRALDAAEGAP